MWEQNSKGGADRKNLMRELKIWYVGGGSGMF